MSAPKHLVFLDATPLTHFARIGELDRLGEWLSGSYTAAYVMKDEIIDWIKYYPHNAKVRDATWLKTIPADNIVDAQLIAELSRRFPARDTKSIGELHVIALTKRLGGTAIIEDGHARKAAQQGAGIKSTFMVSMIGAAAACALISENDAWDLQKRLEVGRDRSVICSTNSKEFREMVRFMKELHPRWAPWPDCLHNNGLDQIAIAARKGQLGILRGRLGL